MASARVCPPRVVAPYSPHVVPRAASAWLCRRAFVLETIKSSTEISQVFAQGKRLSGSHITLLVQRTAPEHDPRGRVAFIAGKKNGNAVWRSRAKRRMREIARDAGGPWAGFDVVFVAKRSTPEQMYSKVLQQTKNLLQDYLKECK